MLDSGESVCDPVIVMELASERLDLLADVGEGAVGAARAVAGRGVASVSAVEAEGPVLIFRFRVGEAAVDGKAEGKADGGAGRWRAEEVEHTDLVDVDRGLEEARRSWDIVGVADAEPRMGGRDGNVTAEMAAVRHATDGADVAGSFAVPDVWLIVPRTGRPRGLVHLWSLSGAICICK